MPSIKSPAGKWSEATKIVQSGNHLLPAGVRPQLLPPIGHIDRVDEFHARIVKHPRSHLEALKAIGIALESQGAGQVFLPLLGQQPRLVKIFTVGPIQFDTVAGKRVVPHADLVSWPKTFSRRTSASVNSWRAGATSAATAGG